MARGKGGGAPGQDAATAGFGARLRALRQQRGLSQTQLAGEELSVSYVSLLEADRRTPTPRVLTALATRLGVDESVLTGPPDPDRSQEHRLALRLAELDRERGDLGAARERLAGLVRDLPEQDALRPEAEFALARVDSAAGALEQAVLRLERLRVQAEADPARGRWLDVVVELCQCYRQAGDLARAVDVGEQAAGRARELGPDLLAESPRLLVTLAGAYRERGDLLRATQLLEEVLQALPTDLAADPRSAHRGMVWWNAAVVAVERGHRADAVGLAEQALRAYEQRADERGRALVRVVLGWALLEQDPPEPERAVGLLHEAQAALLAMGEEVDAAYAETELSRAAFLRGDGDGALRWARSALGRLGDRPVLEAARARVALSRALYALDELAAAVDEGRRAVEALERCAADRQAAVVWRELGDLLRAEGAVEEALGCYGRALDAAAVLGRGATWVLGGRAARAGSAVPH